MKTQYHLDLASGKIKSPAIGWNKKKFEGAWAKTLQGYLAKQQDKVPPGWVRGDQALRLMGFRMKHLGGGASKVLINMVKDGVILKKDFRIFDNTGRRLAIISHYKIA